MQICSSDAFKENAMIGEVFMNNSYSNKDDIYKYEYYMKRRPHGVCF